MDKTNALLHEARIQADENRSKDTRHFAASVVEAIEELQEQLAAALAAIEAKDAALNDEYSYQDANYHEPNHNLSKAINIKPDASILKAHDEALIERCAEVAYEELDDPFLSGHGYATRVAAAIRELKGKI